jgi:Sulfatase-modifying factor enzyme 1
MPRIQREDARKTTQADGGAMSRPRAAGFAIGTVVLAVIFTAVLGPVDASRADVRPAPHIADSVAPAAHGEHAEHAGHAEHADRAEHAERIRTEGTAAASASTSAAARAPSCPAGMLPVDGDYCGNLQQDCLRWLDKEHLRCAEFAPSTCMSGVTHQRFCIDRFEHPNRVGVKPVVMKTWYEADAACKSQRKRLCRESEWTLACEGDERRPYPYGFARDATACNIDHELPVPDARVEKSAAHWKAPVDQREASGARPACTSPFGVADMTGNVDEWVAADDAYPKHEPAAGTHRAALKGGYWGPVRNRCRSATRAHDENFAFYQIGFRCCSDPR